ncbi:unnamed protein product, partial [Rotaria sp. Silwood1]
MAEAHEAVAFSFAVGPGGFNVDLRYDVFKDWYFSCLRSWRLSCHRTLNSLHNFLYPGHPIRGLICCGAIPALYFKGYDPSFGVITWLEEHIFRRYFQSKNATILACVTFAAGAYICVIQIRQYTLKALFSYHGWMYQKHGQSVGLMPKLWMGLVKLFVGRNPSLYSCQNVLPTLPLPSLDDTLQRYLRTVRPLYNDEEYQRVEKLANEFKQTIGRKLQRYLWFKWFFSSNYITDWWEKFVYLRGRSPIMVNSNFYCLDAVFDRSTMKQTARAANIVYAAFKYRTELELQQMKPLMIQNLIPLCSSQYERQFNTVRIPGKEMDRIVHYPDSHHIAVYHKGRWYQAFMYHKGKLLKPCELQIQLDEIIRDETLPADGEEHLAALTAGDRTLWATTRETFFSTGCNRLSLKAIEKAAFVLILEDAEFEIGRSMSPKFDDYARAMLHGKGYDRWFDKSFNFVVGKNAVFGFNAEHSWADAPVCGHMAEYILSEDIIVLGYDENGNTRGIPRFNALRPIKLEWCIPDADSGHFNLTYEASMTRLFRNGRTETVRSCSIESSTWVKAMEDPMISNVERIRLLRIACDYHQQQYRDAMSGKGIDRHLFCLYVISKYLNLVSPFLQQVLQEPWKLSTSQVAHDGYGVSYIIDDDIIYFHISSRRSSPETDSQRFGTHMRKAFTDIRAL